MVPSVIKPQTERARDDRQLAAGEPVWYKGDPTTIPPGGVAQAVVRLRYVPVTRPVVTGESCQGYTSLSPTRIDR